VFFLGVLLCGCARRGVGAEQAGRGSKHGHVAARAGSHIPSVTGQESLRYSVRVDPALTRLEVEACPTGFAVQRLNAPSPGAQVFLADGKIITPEGDYPCPDEGVDLPRLKPGECLRYALALPTESADRTAFRRVDADVLLSPDVWLWIPTPRPFGVHVRAHFELPDGLSAAVPWPGSGTDFEIPETAFAWKSGGAFTHTPARKLSAPDAELDLAVLGDGFAEHDAAVQRWLEAGARTSSLLFGHFPVPRALVLAVPGDRKGAAFGMALRGGGPAVVIFLDRHASEQTLADDWTCTHEFLHLSVPRLPPEDAWLFEGLATYYTEVMRARAGVITEAEAYQHLLDGFARGRSGAGGHTLRDDSAEMRARHAFFRVYWSGAALAFLTDVAARRAGGNTLDAALRSFADCCASAEDDWTAERVLARLDAALGAPRFAERAKTWLDRKEFPDLTLTLRALGVAPGAHGQAALTRAPDAAIRDAIMARDLHAGADGDPHQRQ
jgi:hypothetical protein